jgi:uncharacterized protein YpuA (DUF1002 family)
MTNIERANKIEEIKNKLNPIGQRKIVLETKLKLLKEQYFKNQKEDSIDVINKIQGEYILLLPQFDELYIELRSYQKKYLVQYTGELTEPISETTYNRQYLEELFLNTQCDINTFTNGWEHYMTNQDATQVIEEIYSFIYKCRFTKFSIDNIKSL